MACRMVWWWGIWVAACPGGCSFFKESPERRSFALLGLKIPLCQQRFGSFPVVPENDAIHFGQHLALFGKGLN
jgi:hypothetical protein